GDRQQNRRRCVTIVTVMCTHRSYFQAALTKSTRFAGFAPGFSSSIPLAFALHGSPSMKIAGRVRKNAPAIVTVRAEVFRRKENLEKKRVETVELFTWRSSAPSGEQTPDKRRFGYAADGENHRARSWRHVMLTHGLDHLVESAHHDSL